MKIRTFLTVTASIYSLSGGYSSALPLKMNSENVTNFYLSYYSPADVSTQISYQAQQGVNSTIIWEMSGDVDPVTDPANSLIYAISATNPKAYSIAYWPDWSIYSANRALPYAPYFIPGAIGVDGAKITNQNFDDKAQYLNAIVYSFLEIAPDGTVYFNDPWSDLQANDPWCNKGERSAKIK